MSGPVSQAGKPMHGKINFKLSKQLANTPAIKQGVTVTASLYGFEDVYWAKGYTHDRNRTSAFKHMVNGDNRRE